MEATALAAIQAFLQAQSFAQLDVDDRPAVGPYVAVRLQSPYGLHILHVSRERLADRGLEEVLTPELAERLRRTRTLYLTHQWGVTASDPRHATPPEVVEYRGYRIEASAQPSVEGGMWAPVVTLRWTRQDTGREEHPAGGSPPGWSAGGMPGSPGSS